MMHYTTINVDFSLQNRIATVTLNRPEVHNALNIPLMQELQTAFETLSNNTQLHAVVLAGAGKSFCAGADIQMMQASARLSEAENLQEAQRLAILMHTINTFPCPIVARVHGNALGGGVGLVAVADIVIASEQARFAFSEVKLGIAPAVISPYVIEKIGVGHAHALFVTGERFDAQRAQTLGLVHSVVPTDQLDARLEQTLTELANNAPAALRACKALATTVGHLEDAAAMRTYTTELIARLRVSPEGQEGLAAFLEKRQPAWRLA